MPGFAACRSHFHIFITIGLFLYYMSLFYAQQWLKKICQDGSVLFRQNHTGALLAYYTGMKFQRLNIDDNMHCTTITNHSNGSNRSTGSSRLLVCLGRMLALLAILLHTSTFAQTDTARQALEFAAMSALQQQWQNSEGRVEIQLANLDPRLQIPACPAPLEAQVRSQNPNGGRVTVRVACQGAAPWTRHIAATVDIFQPVIVASAALSRGTRLTLADLSLEEQNVSQLRGRVYSSPEDLIGMELQRSLSPGTPVTDALIQKPVLVKRGETVVLTATRGGVSIRQTATAMQDGRKGQQISVRNTSTDRTIRAIVTGTGEADVVF
jgi:flagella basal body P-ring formation protein FlgA